MTRSKEVEEFPIPRLLLVSNRLPITVRLERGQVVVGRSAGGLATGLRGVHANQIRDI